MAKRRAEYLQEEMARGSVFPSISKIRQCSHAVAVACIRHAHDLGIAKASPGCDHNRGETYEQWVTRKMYYPEYAPIYTSHTR